MPEIWYRDQKFSAASLDALIEDEILTHRDAVVWNASTAQMEHEKELLTAVSNPVG